MHRTLMHSYGVEVIIEADDPKIFEHVKNIAREALVGRVRFDEPEMTMSAPKYSFLTQKDGTIEFDIDGVTSGEF